MKLLQHTKGKHELQELKFIDQKLMINTTEETKELKDWRVVYNLGVPNHFGPKKSCKKN